MPLFIHEAHMLVCEDGTAWCGASSYDDDMAARKIIAPFNLLKQHKGDF